MPTKASIGYGISWLNAVKNYKNHVTRSKLEYLQCYGNETGKHISRKASTKTFTGEQ